MLDDPGKTTTVIGLGGGWIKFIHSGTVIPRDLSPANILLDERGDAKMSDVISRGFSDLRLTMTSCARFLSPCVSQLDWIDDRIDEEHG
jgi:serine/threonine protein kinase